MKSFETDAVAAAVAIHRQGKLEEAGKAYLNILDSEPDNADVLNYFGMLEFQRGNSDRGIELAEHCLSLDSEHASACNNLANMYLTVFRVEEAEHYYRKSIEIDAQAVQPLHNLAVIEKARKNHEAAEALFLRVLRLDPEYIVSMSALADLYIRQGLLEPAFELMKVRLEAEKSAEGQKGALLSLARLSLMLDRKDEAVGIYNRWLQLFPGDPTATHMLAALSGNEVPEKPDERYIRDLFDGFASSFDSVLDDLDYQAPQHIRSIIETLYEKAPPATLRIVDAGCGTGLCGNFLKPLASRLIGVDLSPGMLSRAGFRNFHDELIEQDLTDFLRERPGTTDLIVCADTLCYFGSLADFLEASHSSLVSGGRLVCTVERHDGKSPCGYHLEPHGRYSHTLEYLQESIKGIGLDLEAALERGLRLERGQMVEGYLLVARKPPVS